MGGGVSSSSRRAGGHSVTLKDVVEHDIAKGERPTGKQRGAELPTPTARDWKDGELPERQGAASLSAVLLPTPIVMDSEEARNATSGRSNPDHGAHSGETLLDAMTLLGLADPGAAGLMPTPSTSNRDGNHRRSDGSLLLPGVAEDVQLLPTPAASQHNDSEDAAEFRARQAIPRPEGGRNGLPLPIAVQELDDGPVDETADGEPVRWAKYRAAILRAQVAAGRLAPSPTVADGKGGKRRLAARFVEWMMLLPVGWVTGVPGLSRRDLLRMLGNGVVPAQASAAVVILLGRVDARLRERRAGLPGKAP